jgi:hypothetical protein
MTIKEMLEIVTNITFNYSHEQWRLILQLDKKSGNRPYIQVIASGVDQHTGKPMDWSGRKWYLSEHMCRNEVVRTAHKAFRAAMEHEVDEMFLYKGVAIYNPHLDPDKLVEFAGNHDNIDERVNVKDAA